MKQYYYVDNAGQQQGPVPSQSLRAHGVTLNTLVWCEGMQNWAKVAEIPELYSLFDTPSAPPVPPVINTGGSQPATNRNNLGPCPDNHLVWAILVTIFCCLPFGIPAIVNAAKVESLWLQGDKQGAYEKADSAKTWCWVSFGLGLGFALLYYLYLMNVATATNYMF